jgi:hypothetical protein
MAGLLRSARPALAALLTLALVVGVNGFTGAVHSAHHSPALAQAHEHGAHDGGHDRGHGQPDTTPARTPDESCPVADAALHLAAAEVAALPALDFSPAEPGLVAAQLVDAPSLASREPGSGRAPPSLQSPVS